MGINYNFRQKLKKAKNSLRKHISVIAVTVFGLGFFASSALAATPWNLNGNYEIAFTCTSGCSGTYTHETTISGQNNSGNFNITGGYPVSGPPYDFAWSGTGNVSGNAVTMNVTYTSGADTTNTDMAMNGTVSPSGTMSGNWTDDYPNGTGNRSGTWTTISGKASTTSKKVVTEANKQGWMFNPDPTNATPYNFTEDQASIGDGSLYVQPIGANPLHKFIASKTLGTLVSDFESISYDFMIAGNGDASDASQFYLNIYTNTPGSTTFYDCRFDYVPTTGSTSAFTTASFNAADTPANVADRADTFTCPTTLSGMPAGSTIRAVVLNVGDTTANDQGLAGYLDNVVINTGNHATIYDFELVNTPTNKNQCKHGGWQNYTDNNGHPFRNQGQCVSYFNHNRTTNHNNVRINNNNNQTTRSGNANVRNNTTGGNATSGGASNSNNTTNNVNISNNPTF